MRATRWCAVLLAAAVFASGQRSAPEKTGGEEGTWQAIAAEAASMPDPARKAALLQTIRASRPVVTGTARAGILGGRRHDLGRAAEAAMKAGASGRSGGLNAKDYASIAVASYAQAVLLETEVSESLCRMVAISSKHPENWPAVRSAVVGAITHVSALAWRRRIVNVLTGAPVCQNPAEAIPKAGVRALFGGLLLTYSAVPLTRFNFYCQEWPDLRKIAGRHPKLSAAIGSLNALYGHGSCPPEPTFAGPFDIRSALTLRPFTDDQDTVSNIVRNVADDILQSGEPPGAPGSWTPNQIAAIERYRVAWSLNRGDTGSAWMTADLLASHKEAPPGRGDLHADLLKKYTLPSERRRKLWRRMERIAAGNLHATFDEYTRADLDNLANMFGALRKKWPEIEFPDRLQKHLDEQPAAPGKPQPPAPSDGSKIIRGVFAREAGAAEGPGEGYCPDSAGAGSVTMLRAELHTFWPRSIYVSSAAVPAAGGEFSMRFRRRLVAGQHLSIRDYLTGCSFGAKWSAIPVRPRRSTPRWLPGDGGRTRVYLEAGAALLFSRTATAGSPTGGLTVDHNLGIRNAGALNPVDSGRDSYPPPEARDRGLTAMWNVFARAECAPLQVSSFLAGRDAGSDLIRVRRSGSFELGLYAPVFRNRLFSKAHLWKFGIIQRDDRPRAVFIAPMVKTGVQLMGIRDGGAFGRTSATFWSGGARIGLLRFVPAHDWISSSLLGYLDIGFGQWQRFALPGNSRPRRLELAGTASLPWKFRLVNVGVNVNFGQGRPDIRAMAGLRFDLGWTAAKLSRPPLYGTSP